ncbi:MAG: hypothetical protein E7053_09835 [Lentisphaerae bacterium]|nr:hypothetical protein [Lentisphaerota bacterium]
MSKTVLSLLLLTVLCIPGFAGDVATVYSGFPSGQKAFMNEHDETVRRLGFTADKYENTRLPELSGKLAQYKIVFLSTTSNYENTVDMAPYAASWRRWIENGGILLVEDANYDSIQHKFLHHLGPEFRIITSQCSSNTRPSAATAKVTFDVRNPLVSFPAPTEPDGKSINHWSHIHSAPRGWIVLERCYDKAPVTMVRFVGKGAVMITVRGTYTHENEIRYFTNLIRNIQAALNLRAKGIRISDINHPETSSSSSMSFILNGPAEVLRSIRFELEYTGAGGVRKESVTPEIVGQFTRCTVPVTFDTCGEVNFTAGMYCADELIASGKWVVNVPDLFEIKAKRTHFYPGYDNLDIVYTVSGGDSAQTSAKLKVTSQREVKIFDLQTGSGEVSVDISGYPVGRHELKLELIQDGKTIASQDVTFFRHPFPKAYIRPDGTLLINGEPFFPMGFYHVSWRATSEHRMAFMKDIARYGYNLVAVSFYNFEKENGGKDFIEFLDECHKRGVYVFVEFGFDLRMRGIAEFKHHPAILGWSPGDEPAAHGWSPQVMFGRYTAMKQLDPDHLVFTIVCMPRHYKDYAAGTDIFAPDPYPVPDSPLDMAYGRYKEAGIETRKYGNAFWTVPQCFGGGNTGWKRYPNPQEYRVLIYMSLISGAKGLINYAYYDDSFMLPDDAKDLYEASMAMPAELASLTPFILNGKLSLLKEDNQGIYAAVWELDGKRAYVILNASAESTLPFALDGDFTSHRVAAGEVGELSASAERLTGRLAPLERVVIYCD